uniref:Potassium channel tetramerisation-type BTB domain-containing protein n=1 Tax=Nomascus leucogenys TaxID=61853 RepID=A0A2I3GX64_NOMLE
MLAHMLKDRGIWGNKQDHRGTFLIDQSPEYFEPILNYLCHGQLIVNDGINLLGVLEEARFFGIDSLIEHLEMAITNSQPPEDHSPISQKEFVQFLLATPTKSELLNFSGADLSPDLSGSVFDCANLQGVKMLCSNAEGASLKLCNFEDPSGLKANLEGANLKGVDMEGSQMTGINLRAATLKNAKLKNCNLRGATLNSTIPSKKKWCQSY